jgi:hypothetical protein
VGTPRDKVRRRWLRWLGAAPVVVVVAGLIAVPGATHASARTTEPVVAGLIAVPGAAHAPAPAAEPVIVNNVQTGKCLDSNASQRQGGVGASGVPLPQMRTIYSQGDTDMGAAYAKSCNGGNFQRWTFNLIGFLGKHLDPVYTIIDAQTGQCLDSNLSAQNPGDPNMGAAYTKSCTRNNPFQQWRQQLTGNGLYDRYVNVATGKCLGSNMPGQALNAIDSDMGADYTKSCNRGGSQNWVISPA